MTPADTRKEIKRIVRESLPGLSPAARDGVAKKISSRVDGLVSGTYAEAKRLRQERDAAEKLARETFLGHKSKREVNNVIKTLQLIMERESGATN